MRRRGMMLVMIAMVIAGTLLFVGRAFGQSAPDARASGYQRSTVAAFCAAHTSREGFAYWSYGGQQTFLQIAVNVARSNRRDFEDVAGTLCAMLHRVDTGHRVLVPDPGSKAPTRRPISGVQLRSAIRRLEQLPDAQ